MPVSMRYWCCFAGRLLAVTVVTLVANRWIYKWVMREHGLPSAMTGEVVTVVWYAVPTPACCVV
jgi:hypothetical protein